jgi:hypothetical protein
VSRSLLKQISANVSSPGFTFTFIVAAMRGCSSVAALLQRQREAAMRGKAQAAIAALLQDYAKMVENSEPQLADVVLVVEGERLPAV